MFSPTRDTVKASVHTAAGVVGEAEPARVGGLQRLAIVSRREAVDGVRAPSRTQRVEQLRSKAAAVVPDCRHVRKAVGPHVELARHPLEREQESTLDRGGLPPGPAATWAISQGRTRRTSGRRRRTGHRAARDEHAAEVIYHHTVMSSREKGAGGHDESQWAAQLPSLLPSFSCAIRDQLLEPQKQRRHPPNALPWPTPTLEPTGTGCWNRTSCFWTMHLLTYQSFSPCPPSHHIPLALYFQVLMNSHLFLAAVILSSRMTKVRERLSQATMLKNF